MLKQGSKIRMTLYDYGSHSNKTVEGIVTDIMPEVYLIEIDHNTIYSLRDVVQIVKLEVE